MTTHSSVTRRVNLVFRIVFLWRDVDKVGFKPFFIQKNSSSDKYNCKCLCVCVCVGGTYVEHRDKSRKISPQGWPGHTCEGERKVTVGEIELDFNILF